jgi:peptidyl-tRNA hydrolase, PTH1 family
MKLIVGLGNPGKEYEGTRHNIGFEVVKKVAAAQGIALKKDRLTNSYCGTGSITGHKVVCCFPQTYMNLSGSSVSAVSRRHRIAHSDILVVCDDLDLAFGRLKIRPSGSHAGHRGMLSIIEALGSRDICRLRIGIGRPDAGDAFYDPADYVLSRFSACERHALDSIIEWAAECCECWVVHGITQSMATFNKPENTSL